jgi:hypothetical protein
MAESDAGIVLIIVGILLMVTGIFFLPLCGIGLILIIVGIVLVATTQSQPVYHWPAPPFAAPPVAPPAAGTPPAAPGAPACPVCGSALTWVPQYGHWYCWRCQAYR